MTVERSGIYIYVMAFAPPPPGVLDPLSIEAAKKSIHTHPVRNW